MDGKPTWAHLVVQGFHLGLQARLLLPLALAVAHLRQLVQVQLVRVARALALRLDVVPGALVLSRPGRQRLRLIQALRIPASKGS